MLSKGFGMRMDRRGIVMLAAMALLAGCKVIPKGPPSGPPPVDRPSAEVLPTDARRHRVALLVPMTGPNGGVGQAIANAATMALLDTNADNLRITTYDTSAGAQAAATRAIADGNKLVLGPLLADDIPAIAATARAARVPVISFSNDEAAASRDVFVMGSLPGQSIARTVAYAKGKGMTRFAALVPDGEYGQRASSAFLGAVQAQGGRVVAMETFNRSNTSVTSAARRLRDKGGYDAVLIADGGRIAAQAAPSLRAGATSPRILGNELWSGESVIAQTPALRGALFSAVSDTRFRQFAESYKSRFGAQPYRIATLGYDAVLLTIRIARDWRPGSTLPTARLSQADGFLGVDGAFRFGANGVIQRAMEVREVRPGAIAVVSEAPAGFGN